MSAAFDTPFDALPAEIPLFPLPRVILLPRVQLPLNIFEPRYLALTRAAMAGQRLIGIIQRRSDGDENEIFATGCAGRIVSYSETDDGRYLVTLKGVCRFNVAEEPPPDTAGFRRVRPNWHPYAADTAVEEKDSGLCRDALTRSLRAYFDKRGMICEKWREMKDISCARLISTLSVVLPFDATEKQALLEAMSLPERARLLQCFLENALREGDAPRITCH